MIKGKFTLLVTIILLTNLFSAFAQHGNDDKAKRPSPPAKASNTTSDGVTIAIDYGAPSVKNRKIWGELVPYGKVWRTGANEATTFTVDQDILVEGKKLTAGKYALFTIPEKDGKVTIIFNKKADQWGAYDYKEGDDALRVDVKSKTTSNSQEQLKFDVEKNGKVTFGWEKLQFSFNAKKA